MSYIFVENKPVEYALFTKYTDSPKSLKYIKNLS